MRKFLRQTGFLVMVTLICVATAIAQAKATAPREVFRDSDGNLVSNNEFVDIRMANFNYPDATIIKILDDGTKEFRLQKVPQEGIEELQARFREVSVTLSAVKQLPQPLPEGWLLPEIDGHRLRFIFARYAGDAPLFQQLARHFGAIDMECEPLSLRAIANALMQQRKRDLQR